MKFLFHGASYEHQPLSLEVTEGEIGGNYRGIPWKTHHLKNRKIHPSLIKTELIYRGISYRRP